MDLKGLLKIERYKLRTGHYVIVATVPVGWDETYVTTREFHLVKRPSGKSWEAIETTLANRVLYTRARLGDVQSDVYGLIDSVVHEAQKLFDHMQSRQRPTSAPVKRPTSMDRSTADAVLLDVLSDDAKRVTLDEWSSVITGFLKAWYASPHTDMHLFGREWVTGRVQDIHRSLLDGTAGFAPTFASGEGR